jgi:malonyl-CoA/methylmalonyl-CoA synthetase
LTNESGIQLITRAEAFRDRTAVVADDGHHTYGELLEASATVAACLLGEAGDLSEARVAFMVPPSFQYTATQWGIWRAGGVAVPLAIDYPQPELEYIVANVGASVVVAHPQFEETLRPIASRQRIPLLLTSQAMRAGGRPLPAVTPDRRAMVLYTSGTTGKPKGVVTTHLNIQAQVASLVEAWEWQARDRILLALPLHHVHGIVNVLTCALWSGALCEMLPRFDAGEVWERILQGRLTLFMAVPTIYAKLITAWEKAAPARRQAMTEACKRLRLMVSGSAALPVPLLEQWKAVSGHVLLERYGMTEIGMALSNPLHGQRRPGYVGATLPGVELRLADESGSEPAPGTPGEIMVRGPGVFLEYWANPSATQEAFRDGWFCTGDIAVVQEGAFRILGRGSIDIIKTGGYKVSALEIEGALLSHPSVQECAVVGMPDTEWGERVCVAVVLQPGKKLTLESLRAWAKEQLAPYKVPTRLLVVEQLPRNAMGKVVKPELAKWVHASTAPRS